MLITDKHTFLCTKTADVKFMDLSRTKIKLCKESFKDVTIGKIFFHNGTIPHKNKQPKSKMFVGMNG